MYQHKLSKFDFISRTRIFNEKTTAMVNCSFNMIIILIVLKRTSWFFLSKAVATPYRHIFQGGLPAACELLNWEVGFLNYDTNMQMWVIKNVSWNKLCCLVCM